MSKQMKKYEVGQATVPTTPIPEVSSTFPTVCKQV